MSVNCQSVDKGGCMGNEMLGDGNIFSGNVDIQCHV